MVESNGDEEEAADEDRPLGKRPKEVRRTGEGGRQQEQNKERMEEEDEEKERSQDEP